MVAPEDMIQKTSQRVRPRGGGAELGPFLRTVDFPRLAGHRHIPPLCQIKE